jgi:hypothetical protein
MRKQRLMYVITSVLAVTVASVFFTACSDSEKNARLVVRLTDAPGDYEEVNIDIQGVQVHTNGGNPESGWMSLDVIPGVYNVLELTNGLDTLLGVIELPPGRVSQIRLILGNNNTLKVDGETFALTTPSAQQSGLKINVQADLVGGITYTILLDFDAARSIVKTGSGNYILKPVIRAIAEATTGAIVGEVSIAASTPAVFAIIGLDTLGSSFADETGRFMIKGLSEGSYTVSFSPAEGYTIDDINNVIVTVGNVTNVGVVTVNE